MASIEHVMPQMIGITDEGRLLVGEDDEWVDINGDEVGPEEVLIQIPYAELKAFMEELE